MMWILLFTVSLACLLEQSFAQYESCSGRTFDYECKSLYRTSLYSLQYFSVDSGKTALDKMCDDLKRSRQCITNYKRRCARTQVEADELQRLLDSSSKVAEEMCTEGHPVREDLLKHADCLEKNSDETQRKCINASREMFEKTVEEEKYWQRPEDRSRKDIQINCCIGQVAMECITKVLGARCSEETSDYMRKQHEKRLYNPQSSCDRTWTYDSEVCKSVLPEEFIDSMTTLGAMGNAPSLIALITSLLVSITLLGRSGSS